MSDKDKHNNHYNNNNNGKNGNQNFNKDFHKGNPNKVNEQPKQEQDIKKEQAKEEQQKPETKQEKTPQELEIEKLKSELEKTQKESADFKDKWIRNVAEFDNYKKRNASIWQDAYNEGKIDIIEKILSVGDNLELALNMNLDEKTSEGIKLTLKKFQETLKNADVEEINPVGETFDPNIAEAVMQVDATDGEKSDTIKQVFQKGYKIKNKIVRYAKVSVIK